MEGSQKGKVDAATLRSQKKFYFINLQVKQKHVQIVHLEN